MFAAEHAKELPDEDKRCVGSHLDLVGVLSSLGKLIFNWSLRGPLNGICTCYLGFLHRACLNKDAFVASRSSAAPSDTTLKTTLVGR
eukprot:5468811-Amphidinium_carterae.1